MTKRSGGLLSGRSRHLARHHKPSRLSIRAIIKQFEIGDKVAIVPTGNSREIPHPRHKGKIGVVLGKRGAAYVVKVSAMRNTRTLVVLPKHLKKVVNIAKKAVE